MVLDGSIRMTTSKWIKPRNKVAQDLLTNPRYKHLVHKSKLEVIHKQLLEEGKQEIKEFLIGETKV